MTRFLLRTRFAVCCVASIAALAALVFSPAAGAAKVGSTYLALGDSLAFGFHQAQAEEELKSGKVDPASFNDGYVDDFGASLRLLNPSLSIINDGCPGETTDTFINGSGTPGFCAGGPTGTPFPYAFLHHPYTTNSQLSDALAILAKTPKVSPITLDIGSNDVLQALVNTCGFPTKSCTEAQVAALFAHIASNTGLILAQLHAAAPKAQIVLIGAYNAFPTVVPNGDKLQAVLNGLQASVAAKVPGASFADPEPVFNPSGTFGGPEAGDIPTICTFTAMCPGGKFSPESPHADVHPSKLGYAVIAGVIGADFLAH
jgi:lysophospholipase L1-like esterase